MSQPAEPESRATPDDLFTVGQQRQLADLMVRSRRARNAGTAFPAEEQAEPDALIAAELGAATLRAGRRSNMQGACRWLSHC